MTTQPSLYRRHRFPAGIISHAVWLYHPFSLSLRDIALILAEHGVAVTHESIRHWCRKFGGKFARRWRRRRPGSVFEDALLRGMNGSRPHPIAFSFVRTVWYAVED
jgi:putative transposase